MLCSNARTGFVPGALRASERGITATSPQRSMWTHDNPIDLRIDMETLELYFGRDKLRHFVLGDSPLEVGRGHCCDIVVQDPEVAERHCLIKREKGKVVTYDLRPGEHDRHQSNHWPYDAPLALGQFHHLKRSLQSNPQKRRRAAAQETWTAEGEYVLVVGTACDRREYVIGDAPLYVGTANDNSVVLNDDAVSAYHCRFDPGLNGLRLRDLGSCAGTYVQGVRIFDVALPAYAQVRVGHTTLRVLPRQAPSVRGEGRRMIVAASRSMREIMTEVSQLARVDWPVLLSGESGVGKEVVATSLHQSSRPTGAWVAINAGGLPRELIESELFGHERGAFTGAVRCRKGAFELADGGSLFLDEVGELPLDLQSRFLRTLETWKIRRVGGEDEIAVNVRLITATHRDLRQLVRKGRFREDLYHRLARWVIEIPPLRERTEDIAELSQMVLDDIKPQMGCRSFSKEAEARLKNYRWRGNVRELRNVISVACLLSPGSVIEATDIEQAYMRVGLEQRNQRLNQSVHALLAQHDGNISAAARAAGWPRSTFRDRLRSELNARKTIT